MAGPLPWEIVVKVKCIYNEIQHTWAESLQKHSNEKAIPCIYRNIWKTMVSLGLTNYERFQKKVNLTGAWIKEGAIWRMCSSPGERIKREGGREWASAFFPLNLYGTKETSTILPCLNKHFYHCLLRLLNHSTFVESQLSLDLSAQSH